MTKKDKKKQKQDNKANLKKSERKLFDPTPESEASSKLDKKTYEKELARLQLELVKMQYWVKHTDKQVGKMNFTYFPRYRRTGALSRKANRKLILPRCLVA